MLAIAIIIGVVYMAFNYAEKSSSYPSDKQKYNAGSCSYKDNERTDLQLR